MNKRMNIFVVAAAVVLAAPLAIPALAQIVTTNVMFPKGRTGTNITGTIKGEQTRDYVVRVRAGQVMSVRLSGSNKAYFNVLPPGNNDEAIFIGSSKGNSFSGTLGKAGAYKIRVYQMRASARRGETAGYTLSISVAGGGSAGAGGAGSIAGIQGMSGVMAFDVLTSRGFKSVDSLTSGNTLYGIYYYAPKRLCVQTTSADGKIVDIRDIKTHPKCR